MITKEEFKKALKIVKEYQKQIETEYSTDLRNDILKLETGYSYSPDTEISKIDCGVRLHNLLKCNNIKKLKDLENVSLSEFTKVKGVGKVVTRELIAILHLSGVKMLK